MNWYKRKAGTWSLPYKENQAYKVGEILENTREILTETFQKKLYNVIGDDALWDDMDEVFETATDKLTKLLKAYIKRLLAMYEKSPDQFSDEFDDEALKYLKDISK